MRVLLDNCVNHRLAKSISKFEVIHVRELGWAELTNGKLIQAAEDAGFDVLITVDKSIRKQQNLRLRKLSLLTINSPTILLEDLVQFVVLIEMTLAKAEAESWAGQDIVILKGQGE